MIHYQQGNLTVFQSALYKTTTAVIESAEAVILTDPNWLPGEIDEIRDFVDQRKGNKELYIVYTHSDFDHIIGSGAFPEGKVIATEEFQQHPTKEAAVQAILEFDQKYYIERNYTPSYPEVNFTVVADGETLKVGDLTLTFYKAPGHTNDGLFTVVEPYGIFLAGDYLSDVELPFIYSSYTDYLNTVEKAQHILDTYDLNQLVPGHGSVTDQKREMEERIRFSKSYLQQLPSDSGELEKECREKFRFYDGMKGSHLDNVKMAEETNY